ncbi:hypothetical protein [Pleomorphovibrio marinus]|nr:hypothetical protein [Pleomorphovibrio marinus]
MQKKDQSHGKGVLSKLNDNTDQSKKVVASDKKKGILSKVNDSPNQSE